MNSLNVGFEGVFKFEAFATGCMRAGKGWGSGGVDTLDVSCQLVFIGEHFLTF